MGKNMEEMSAQAAMNKTKIKYVFDVDGTLTPSRGIMDINFALWFADFCEENDVYVVTGSDRAKTMQQLGEHITFKCKRVYQCSGNEVWEQGIKVRTSPNVAMPRNLRNFMLNQIQMSEFVSDTNRWLEDRQTCWNLSNVGRGCSEDARRRYIEWDKATNERMTIAQNINENFPNWTALVGGETGIDIAPKGADKSQILTDFKGAEVYFFGDAMDEGGNDYPLKIANKYGKNFAVKDWKGTWDKLKELVK
jgi:phosphomannomutase